MMHERSHRAYRVESVVKEWERIIQKMIDTLASIQTKCLDLTNLQRENSERRHNHKLLKSHDNLRHEVVEAICQHELLRTTLCSRLRRRKRAERTMFDYFAKEKHDDTSEDN